nr:MAG TPA: hypothetical protein [Caudoviricetes sp.]
MMSLFVSNCLAVSQAEDGRPPLRHSLVRISSYAFKNPLKFRKLRNNCNKRCSYKFA